jgi:hypothetical protein
MTQWLSKGNRRPASEITAAAMIANLTTSGKAFHLFSIRESMLHEAQRSKQLGRVGIGGITYPPFHDV